MCGSARKKAQTFSENNLPIALPDDTSHVMDRCIAGGSCHTAATKSRANFEQQRPMQKNLLSKAATWTSAAILPAA
jgi:hypothetical protein